VATAGPDRDLKQSMPLLLLPLKRDLLRLEPSRNGLVLSGGSAMI